MNEASKQFSEIRFVVGDLTKDKPFASELSTANDEPSTISHELSAMNDERFDLVEIKEVLWYICHNLTQFFYNARQLIKSNGFLYVSQSFPESDTWVGKEIIDSHERLIEILSAYTNPVHYCVERDWNFNGRPLVHYLGKIKPYENK